MKPKPTVKHNQGNLAKTATVTPTEGGNRKTAHFKRGKKTARLGRGSEITAQSVETHALETFGSAAKADHWLNRPNPLFHGQTPRRVIQADPSTVEAALVRIDHGVYT